jgi:polyribonucleotide nucleotidyltransferase
MEVHAGPVRDSAPRRLEFGRGAREAAARSRTTADDEMPDDVRWIRSYVLEEGSSSLGTVCIYEATSPEAI